MQRSMNRSGATTTSTDISNRRPRPDGTGVLAFDDDVAVTTDIAFMAHPASIRSPLEGTAQLPSHIMRGTYACNNC